MFSAVFFDMDGVTVDSEPQWHESERELMADFGYTWLEEDQIACLGGPLSRVGLYMSDKVDNKHDGTWFTNALIERQMEKMRNGVRILPGVLDFISHLRSSELPLALVSASPRNIMDAVLQGLPSGLFDFSISSNDVAQTKPHADPYLLAASKLGIDICDCLVIEDSLTGISSARSAGAWILAVPHYVEVTSDERMRVVSSLENLTIEKIAELFRNE